MLGDLTSKVAGSHNNPRPEIQSPIKLIVLFYREEMHTCVTSRKCPRVSRTTAISCYVSVCRIDPLFTLTFFTGESC